MESAYLVKEGELTGACAVVITGHDRSLVTTLRASEKFEKGYLESERMRELVEGAKVYYVGGFFLTHGVESALVVAKRAAETGKVSYLFSSSSFPPLSVSPLSSILFARSLALPPPHLALAR